MSDDILTDEQRQAIAPVMAAADDYASGNWRGAYGAEAAEAARRGLALTVARALAEARREEHKWACRADQHPDCLRHAELEAECTRLREALGE